MQEFEKAVSLFATFSIAGQAQYLLGDFAATERAMRDSIAARNTWPSQSLGDQRDKASLSTWLALALVRQGRRADAAQIIDPVVKFELELAHNNHGDRWVPVDLASALYVQALAEKQDSVGLLRQAASLLDGVPPAMQAMRDVRQWRDRIREAQQAPGAAL